MNSKWRNILGTVTIILIAGGTVYAIKKAKDAKKEKESEITLEQAKAMMDERRKAEKEAEAKEIEELADEETTQALIKAVENSIGIIPVETMEEKKQWVKNHVINVRPANEEPDDEEYEEEEDEEIGAGDGYEFRYTDGFNPKEDLELRYEPSSLEARNQYIRMELSEWQPHENTYQTLLKLFNFPFQPENDGDDVLRNQLIDFRVQFFGFESKWVKDISIADVILHYSRAAEFNCGESIAFWAEYFLDFNELDSNSPSHDIDEMLKRLNSHTYFNEERQTFGLFGLTRNSMDQAITIAERNIDRSVTYEIEFNEFLKSCI